jgi:hypothetical protein
MKNDNAAGIPEGMPDLVSLMRVLPSPTQDELERLCKLIRSIEHFTVANEHLIGCILVLVEMIVNGEFMKMSTAAAGFEDDSELLNFVHTLASKFLDADVITKPTKVVDESHQVPVVDSSPANIMEDIRNADCAQCQDIFDVDMNTEYSDSDSADRCSSRTMQSAHRQQTSSGIPQKQSQHFPTPLPPGPVQRAESLEFLPRGLAQWPPAVGTSSLAYNDRRRSVSDSHLQEMRSAIAELEGLNRGSPGSFGESGRHSFDSLSDVSDASQQIEMASDGYTLAVRGVPARYTQSDLVEMWTPRDCQYDFLHLPYSKKQHRSVTYCFINFISKEASARFRRDWSQVTLPVNRRQPQILNGVPLSIAPSKVQGFRANLMKVASASISHSLRAPPCVFDAAGDRVDFMQALANLH